MKSVIAKIGVNVDVDDDATDHDVEVTARHVLIDILSQGADVDITDEGEPPAVASQLLVYGNPADGFTFLGPITPNDPAVEEFIDRKLSGYEWWYIDVKSLAEAADGEG